MQFRRALSYPSRKREGDVSRQTLPSRLREGPGEGAKKHFPTRHSMYTSLDSRFVLYRRGES